MRAPRLISNVTDKPDDVALIDRVNKATSELGKLRLDVVEPVGEYSRSKLAWKLATYQQALLYRIVALVDGIAVTLEAESTLCAILAARALMECAAILAAFDKRATSALEAEDLGALDTLAQNGVFATRDPELVGQHPEIGATNIVTYIAQFDKQFSGFKKHYDRLSERCHPNAAGHSYMFSRLDRDTGCVYFSIETSRDENMQNILAALVLVPFCLDAVNRIAHTISKIAALQHEKHPVER